MFGQRETEGAAFPRRRLDPHRAAVALDHLLHDGEPDPRARILALVVQPLEHHEDPLEVLRLDADAVVANRDLAGLAAVVDRDVDLRRRLRAELERVADQVLEYL